MATIIIGTSGTINSTNTYSVGDIGAQGGVMAIQMTSSSFSGTIKVKARTQNNPTGTFVQIPYKKLYLNGAVGDGSEVFTDITDSSLIQVVVSDGLEIALDCTYTSGSMAVKAMPVAAA